MHDYPARTASIKALIDEEHFRFRRHPDAVAAPGEVTLGSDWSLQLDAPCTPVTRRMLEDFRTFCSTGFEVSFPSEAAPRRIIWKLLPGGPDAQSFNRLDPAVESFEIEVTPEAVIISAAHERGLLQGTHRLEWTMADRGGPFLTPGSKGFAPGFMPRISNGIFITGHQDLHDPGAFSDRYLGLMSHYGVNGIHLYLDLWKVFKSRSLPELNAADVEDQIAAMRRFTQRVNEFGIDVYLNLNAPPVMADHPVFLAHPDAKGAPVEIFMEELSGRAWHNLCSSSPKVLAAYSEAIEYLFSTASEVAGAFMIIGGECFYHCYTRPTSREHDTTCPHCAGLNPSKSIAELCNTIGRAVRKTGAHKPLFAWTYSAFVWSRKHDPSQLEFTDHLDPEVSLLTNFDGGDEAIPGSGVKTFDYNITVIGPSKIFDDQARHLQTKGRPIFSKIETTTTPDAFFLPYLPVHTRWQARFESMRAVPVSGVIGQWRFYGMNGAPTEELFYRAAWEAPQNGAGGWLEQIARRDFLLNDAAAKEVVAGWRLLGEAWDFYPYSAMTSGERAAYMRGPFYLGPSHPLIFDVQDNYRLPLDFRLLRGDVAEIATEEERIELQRTSKPRYVADLLVTYPYGVERYLELVGKAREKWEAGLVILYRHLDQPGRARMELDICEAIATHLATLENVVRFYQVRDRIQSNPGTLESFRAGIAELQEITTAEIANAERALPLLRRDPRIGYGHCYGPVYDASMVEAKIEQCAFVRDVELPRFEQVVAFHLWLDPL